MQDSPSLRPHTWRERIHTLLHREPTSFVPHADTTTPRPLQRIDEEAVWAAVQEIIHRVPMDEAHGDIADRYITHRFDAFEAQLKADHARRLQIHGVLKLQHHQNLVKLSGLVRDLRTQLETHRERVSHAWKELCGVEPAQYSSELPVQARPHAAALWPATPAAVPVELPDEPLKPVEEIPALHVVPEPEREQA